MVLAAEGLAALVDGGGAGRLRGEDPAPTKPPWQRLLQSADAKKAAELDGRAATAWQAGKWEEAVRAAEEVRELRVKVQGKDHWEAVTWHWIVAGLRAAQRQNKEVQQEYAGLQAQDGEAQALEGRGRYREAQPLRQKALSIRRKVLGEEHTDTAQSYNNLARNLDDQGKYTEVAEGFRKALSILRKVLGEAPRRPAVMLVKKRHEKQPISPQWTERARLHLCR
jgi:tetratricopeptide (TPR) repeat protein